MSSRAVARRGVGTTGLGEEDGESDSGESAAATWREDGQNGPQPGGTLPQKDNVKFGKMGPLDDATVLMNHWQGGQKKKKKQMRHCLTRLILEKSSTNRCFCPILRSGQVVLSGPAHPPDRSEP